MLLSVKSMRASQSLLEDRINSIFKTPFSDPEELFTLPSLRLIKSHSSLRMNGPFEAQQLPVK